MTLIGLYLAGVATGGLLLFLSIAGGGGDDGAHDAGDTEIELEADDATPHGTHSLGVTALVLTALPVASLRFWTFFLAFGGLTGALLTVLSTLGTVAIAALASVLGYLVGLGAVLLLRSMGRTQVSSTLGRADCVGATGIVLLPLAGRERGRVRIALENQMVDFDAETEEDLVLAPDEAVVIYAVREDGVVLVSAAPDITRT